MITPILLSVLSGIFYVLSFAPWNLSLLQWIAFVPLFIAVQRLELHSTQKQTDSKKTLLRKIALLGFIVSFIIALGGFYWIAYAVEHYGEVPFYFSVGILLLFCITGQLQVPLYLLLRHLAQEKFFRVKTLGWPFLGGLLYVGIEATYPKLFSDTAGNAFFKSPWTRQMVEWGGPFFLTCCSLWINEWVFAAYQARKLKIALVPLALFAFIQGYGAWRTHNLTQAIHAAEKGPLLNVAIIQANIGDFLKVAAERGSTTASHEVMDRYIGLSHQSISASPAPDLIVWPETAYPSLFEKSHSAQDLEMEFKIKQFAKEFRGTLAFGGYDEDLEHVDYNSMFFYRDPEADPFHLGTRIYHKAILLQFGETLPGVDQFPEMKSWFPNMGFFGRGPGPQLFPVHNAQGTQFSLAPSICYEGLFPPHAAESTSLGSDFLLNITNDSWFGENGEPILHLALTTYRSIENRIFMVRSTNTGISAIIDPTGEITDETEISKAVVLKKALPQRINTWRTPTWLAPIFINFCRLLTFALLIYLILGLKRIQQKPLRN